jgi:hypothetical protein
MGEKAVHRSGRPAPRPHAQAGAARLGIGSDARQRDFGAMVSSGPVDPTRATAWIADLNDRLLFAPTVLEALQRWCDEHAIGAGRIITERRRDLDDAAAGDHVSEALRPAQGEQVEVRTVRLRRAGHVLCDVDAWYVPERLPAEIRIALKMSNVPFDAAVRGLAASRRTYFASAATFDSDDHAGFRALRPTDVILEHEAIVVAPPDRPLAVLGERYFAALLGVAAN